MKQFGILSRNPGAVRTSRRITAETFQRCSMSCRFEKLCRYRTIVSYVSYGLINWKIHKKHKMVDELKVFWPGNVWNLHDLWQASLTNDGHAQTISCPGHVGRTSPWRASCPRQSWNLRRRPHSIRITLVVSRSVFRGIVTIGLCWNVDIFLDICHVSHPTCMALIQFYFAVFGPLSMSYWGNNGNVKTLACKQGSPRGANNTRPLNHWATFRALVIRLEKSVTFTYLQYIILHIIFW